jgi:hypothetical protein
MNDDVQHLADLGLELAFFGSNRGRHREGGLVLKKEKCGTENGDGAALVKDKPLV